MYLEKLTRSVSSPIVAHTSHHYSASQLKTFRGCKRAWYYDKVVGLPRPESQALALGTATHAELADYLTGAKGLEALGPLARAAAPLLPAPSPDLHVERPMELRIETDDAVDRQFVGFVDLLVPPTHTDRDGVPLISDHKTTSNFQYALTEYEIAQDVQMLAYGQYALLRYPDADSVELQHTAILTRGKPVARNTSVVVSRPDIEARWLRHLAILPDMEATRAATSASDVEPTGRSIDTCQKYGGCPYLTTCNLDSIKRGPNPHLPATTAMEIDMVRPPDAPKSSYLSPTTPTAYVDAPKKKKKKKAVEAPAVDTKVPAVEATIPTEGTATIYIDCLPIGGAPATLEAWAAPICARIERETGKGWQLHSYREGTGLLVAYAGERELPTEIACSSGAPLTAVLLESILPRATRVVRGVR